MKHPDPQERMNNAISNYLDLSTVLTEDLFELSDGEKKSASWRRNYIRVVAATIEGYSHCFREMTSIGLDLDASNFSKKEAAAMSNGFGLTTSDRIKLTLKVTYRMFEIADPPSFDGVEWRNAALVFEKRHDLMHPKSLNDLTIKDEAWDALEKGANWLVTQHFKFVEKLYEMRVQKLR